MPEFAFGVGGDDEATADAVVGSEADDQRDAFLVPANVARQRSLQ